ncbi:A/G-specific adenine glycosylase [Maribacter sp. ACAM166]|uniref:A/G-specific adenine glycosylase n=1 Tax=Maribacter sp. ACAM166 TaxID=2508996 RepID=UPI0010FE98ED|nr:A/G-specific adenine glycosylase [Maribacter sp. ACAM166]TLP72922.1 A/G-specific adenine glycosylase [Maribacter sp. ACAM166]
MSFSGKILKWYRQNKRSLPWRETIDPYKIWLSEIILQQTRVAQGTPYYLRFVETFPSVRDMANAKEEEVLKLWQGLGYYSRARNLHATAKIVVNEYDAVFPNNYKELLKLKGVGDYTASAISSICYNEAQAVVDGNVYRVLARYFGVHTPINSTEGIKYFKTLAQRVMDANEIRDYNQGIMEFGAIHCTPKKPFCLDCPLNESCVSLQAGTVNQLPIKLKKTKVRDRYFNYLVPIYKDTSGNLFTSLQKREGKGIWQNLWEFPLLEATSNLEIDAINSRYKEILGEIGKVEILDYNDTPILHKLSHQNLHTKFWILNTNNEIPNKVLHHSLNEYPVPVLIADFIKAFKF